jgi:2-hydroxychromene-2-carboxylate isomerase
MTKTLEFIFDFGSPNAYLVWRVLPGLLERTGAELVVTPCLLGGLFKATGNQAPMTAFAGVKGKLEYEWLETRRFIERHGLSRFRMNPNFPLNNLLAMRGLVAAQIEGRGDAYLEAVSVSTWEEGLKTDDPEVLASVLDRAGLDAAALLARTQEPDVKQRLIANTDAAAARGAFGIPTFFVDGEIVYGKERLEQVERMLSA